MSLLRPLVHYPAHGHLWQLYFSRERIREFACTLYVPIKCSRSWRARVLLLMSNVEWSWLAVPSGEPVGKFDGILNSPGPSNAGSGSLHLPSDYSRGYARAPIPRYPDTQVEGEHGSTSSAAYEPAKRRSGRHRFAALRLDPIWTTQM